MEGNDKNGVIFDVQRFCTHDGPGIRTTVFMKGCCLSCRWCHNPESISRHIQIRYFEEKCIGCGKCLPECGKGLHVFSERGHLLDFENCGACGKCAAACPSGALVVCGEYVDKDDVLAYILPDMDFYGDEGGVTFSGGEPLLQADFLGGVLRECKKRGIGTAVDTSGCVPWPSFEKALDYTDIFLYDIKAWDDETHKRATGVSNRLIFDNLERLSETGKRIWIRIPVVDKVNNDAGTMANVAGFLAGLKNIEFVTLMPFHKTGKKKCETIGESFFVESDREIPDGDIERFQELFRARGIALR
jgi:pyruvate formate lyase activating enzyme